MSSTFTVVVPLYNKGDEIGRCVSSVLGQTFRDLELIVIDDGSTDNGAEVVREFIDPRVKLIKQENAGVATARNCGIAEAESEWIAFLDADDTWLSDHLENLNELRSSNPTAQFLASGYWADKGNKALRRVAVSLFVAVPDSFLNIEDGLLVPSCTAMTKAALEMVGGYREIFGEDVDLWFRVGSLYQMAYSRKATAVWHLDAGNRRTHKIQNAGRRAKYIPGGLVPSLDFITAHTTDGQIVASARRYLAARELKAIRRLLGVGDRQHANTLYTWWCQTFGQRDRLMEISLSAPCWLHRGLALIRENARSGRSLLGYGLHHIGLVKPRTASKRTAAV